MLRKKHLWPLEILAFWVQTYYSIFLYRSYFHMIESFRENDLSLIKKFCVLLFLISTQEACIFCLDLIFMVIFISLFFFIPKYILNVIKYTAVLEFSSNCLLARIPCSCNPFFAIIFEIFWYIQRIICSCKWNIISVIAFAE